MTKISNLEKYRSDLSRLIAEGIDLYLSALVEFSSRETRKSLLQQIELLTNAENKKKKIKVSLPAFRAIYQSWYSESLVLLKQLLPDRVSDFVKLYAKPKSSRKTISHENYVIEDALHGLEITRGYDKEKVVGPDAAIPRFEQQLNIIKSVSRRFESSLFDIKQLVQADVFDSELAAAMELNKKGFTRGAGAVAGVVLEGHLLQVCESHNLKIKKKNPGINDLAQQLKDSDVIDTPKWRGIQLLADLRNLCDHKKKTEPSKDDIDELISGASKTIKTVF